jgi:AP2 domain
MSNFHGMCKTGIYKLWTTMIQRCENPNATAYIYYGGRGISVCDKWHSFKNFYEDMGEKPQGKSLDRINGLLGYCKENCRWATHAEQLSNRRKYQSSQKNTSGVLGVYWKSSHNKFVARVTENGKRRYVGFFDSLELAAEAMAAFRQTK